MNTMDWVQLGLYIALLMVAVWPLGRYMTDVYEGKPTRVHRWLGPIERWVYRVSGIRPQLEMDWKIYAGAVLLCNLLGFVIVFALQRYQHMLPFNPQHVGPVRLDSAVNTAVSFATNTNWQGYAGESTMSYLTQMLGLAVQNFLSAATGMAVMVAMIRGFVRQQTEQLGNFWVDLTRSVVYILLPLSFLMAIALVSQGVVQTLHGYQAVALLQPHQKEQLLALGPAASQIAIKQLGTNGGGFFNANSAHPFENPTPLSNVFEMLAILLIPAALCETFGRMVGDRRQGRALLLVMMALWLIPLACCLWAEQRGNPMLTRLGVDQHAGFLQAGGNMEGKEVRFGVVNSAIWATATTAASNGSVNTMHDSLTPLGSVAPLLLMQIGEVAFGGVGSGLYGMLVFVIATVFIAGLMVGRTPEYLGKKIGAFEMTWTSLIILLPSIMVLFGTALAVVSPSGLASLLNPGAHGFTEALYAFCSMANNNGSAFAGLNANTPLYNWLGAVAMLGGRYVPALGVLAIAGHLVQQKRVPTSAGTLPTHTPLFIGLLFSVIVIIGALTFLPALALGPIIEHLQLMQ